MYRIEYSGLKSTLSLLLAIVLIFATSTVSSFAATSNSDEFDRLRQKYFEALAGNGNYDPTVTYIADKLISIDTLAGSAWSTMQKGPGVSSLWPGSRFASSDSVWNKDYDIQEEYNRLLNMAIAYRTYGSQYYNNTQLRDDIVFGMEWLYANMYNTSRPRYNSRGQTFRREIGTPMILTKLMTLMYDDLSDTQISNYIVVFDHCSPDPLKWQQGTSTGANRSNMAQNVAIRGIIGKNPAKISQGINAMATVLRYVESGDGFYADGSFLMHNNTAYMGNYGRGLLRDATMVAYLLSGTDWEIPEENMGNLYRWVYDGYDIMIHDSQIFDDPRGRAVAYVGRNNHTLAEELIGIIVQLALAESPEKEKLQGIAKDMLSKSEWYNTTVGLPFVAWGNEILNNTSIVSRGDLLIYKQYNQMDFTAAHRSNYAVGISMHSSRVTNYEAINNSNLRGWHQGDGWTQIIDPDFYDTEDNYQWSTIDSYRLPGTTVNKNTAYSMNKSDRSWVGGTDVKNLYGVTGMDLHPKGQTLEARKSWFVFDDEIVFLGSGIHSRDNKAVETIVENKMLNDNGTNATYINGNSENTALSSTEKTLNDISSMHIAGITSGGDRGYYFPSSADLIMKREARSGKAIDINKEEAIASNEPMRTKNFAAMWFDHGTNPVNATYEYVVLPGMSRAETDSYAQNPDISILVNNENVHAVSENGLHITAANFWADSRVIADTIFSDKKAAIMMQEDAGVLEISVSDPTQQNTGQIHVAIRRQGLDVVNADSSVTINKLDPFIDLSFDVNNSKGAAQKAYVRVSSESVNEAAFAALLEEPVVPQAKITASVTTPELKFVDDTTGNVSLQYVDEDEITRPLTESEFANPPVYTLDNPADSAYVSLDSQTGKVTLLKNPYETRTIKINASADILQPYAFYEGFEKDFGELRNTSDAVNYSDNAASWMDRITSTADTGRYSAAYRLGNTGYVEKAFDTAQYGTVTMKFYDDLSAVPTSTSTIKIASSVYPSTSITDFRAIAPFKDGSTGSATHYSYRIAGGSTNWKVTKVPRSTGWHEFKWEYATSGLIMSIDGTQIYSSTSDISGFRRIGVANAWNTTAGPIDRFRFDELKFISNQPVWKTFTTSFDVTVIPGSSTSDI